MPPETTDDPRAGVRHVTLCITRTDGGSTTVDDHLPVADTEALLDQLRNAPLVPLAGARHVVLVVPRPGRPQLVTATSVDDVTAEALLAAMRAAGDPTTAQRGADLARELLAKRTTEGDHS